MKQFLIILGLVTLCSADFISDCLSAHKKYRDAVGVQELSWSSELANSAQQWADYQAFRSHLVLYSHTRGLGENIAVVAVDAMTFRDEVNIEGLIDMWGAEKADFIEGCTFPDCSTTGSQFRVRRYTQMVWSQTNTIGCGLSSEPDRIILVCRYTPAGNVVGQKVY